MKDEKINELVRFFWKFGYEPIQIKGSKYLKAPERIGNYEIDILAKKDKYFAIGIVIKNSEIENQNELIQKITYLASLKNKFDKKDIYLFLGCQKENYETIKKLLNFVPRNFHHKIKLFYL